MLRLRGLARHVGLLVRAHRRSVLRREGLRRAERVAPQVGGAEVVRRHHRLPLLLLLRHQGRRLLRRRRRRRPPAAASAGAAAVGGRRCLKAKTESGSTRCICSAGSQLASSIPRPTHLTRNAVAMPAGSVRTSTMVSTSYVSGGDGCWRGSGRRRSCGGGACCCCCCCGGGVGVLQVGQIGPTSSPPFGAPRSPTVRCTPHLAATIVCASSSHATICSSCIPGENRGRAAGADEVSQVHRAIFERLLAEAINLCKRVNWHVAAVEGDCGRQVLLGLGRQRRPVHAAAAPWARTGTVAAAAGVHEDLWIFRSSLAVGFSSAIHSHTSVSVRPRLWEAEFRASIVFWHASGHGGAQEVLSKLKFC